MKIELRKWGYRLKQSKQLKFQLSEINISRSGTVKSSGNNYDDINVLRLLKTRKWTIGTIYFIPWKIKWHDPGDCNKKARNENTRALTFFFCPSLAPSLPSRSRRGNSCFINTRVAIFARLMSNWQTSFAKRRVPRCECQNDNQFEPLEHAVFFFFFIYRHRRPCVKVDNNFTIYIDPAVFLHCFFFPPFNTFYSQRYRFITTCSNSA